MAVIASRHCDPLGNVDVVVDRFEDWVTAGPRFASIVAAHCWHWVDPRVGYAKARSLLHDDGVLAAFWNVPVLEHSELAPAINEVYRALAPSLEDKTSTTRASFADSFERHPGFQVRGTHEYDWDQPYSAAEYTDMLCTHSDHHLLPEPERDALDRRRPPGDRRRRRLHHAPVRDAARGPRPRPDVRVGVCILPEHTGLRRERSGVAPRSSASRTPGPTTTSPGEPSATRRGSAAIPTLTAAASVTERIRLGPLVASPNFRHPVPFAKELVTLDDVSAGRHHAGDRRRAVPDGTRRCSATRPWSVDERAARFAEFVELHRRAAARARGVVRRPVLLPPTRRAPIPAASSSRGSRSRSRRSARAGCVSRRRFADTG